MASLMVTMAPRTHPCIGRCTTTTGDHICKGCGRTVEEIRDWNTYTAEHKKYLMTDVLPSRIPVHPPTSTDGGPE